ncbi:hypothetical protein, partial [Halomonas marinisediminis]|uniref:hypothetical protein n=1 Tax=Halomonas marinisediminis TaxID=2546095 RepID=UPI0014043022
DSRLTAGDGMTVDAVEAGITLTRATATANTHLAMKAGTDIKADSSEVTAESDTLDLEAGSNIALTNSKVDAETGLTATADQGSITLDDSSAEAATGNLAMTAG